MAQSLAAQLVAGDVILLEGDVGAGKTHFARCAILALLKKPEDVPSPTYTLVQTYNGTACEVWHADLYRLTDVSEIEELGLTQAFDTAITLIEWPDRLGDLSPQQALHVLLRQGAGDDARDILISWSDPRWAQKVKAMQDA